MRPKVVLSSTMSAGNTPMNELKAGIAPNESKVRPPRRRECLATDDIPSIQEQIFLPSLDTEKLK